MFHTKKHKLNFINKRIGILLVTAILGGSLAGCGLFPEVNVTEEESRLIAEYAAGLLLKYESGHGIGLEKIKEEPVTEEESVQADTDATSTAEDVSTASADSAQESAGVTVPENTATPVESAVPMAEAMALDGFEVTYQNYEICDIYPQEESEDMLFSIQAAPGYDLLIAHFDLTNLSENEQVCDMLSNDSLFYLEINGSERASEQMTILMNDLEQFQDTVAGYGMVDTVLVFEVGEGLQENLDSLHLIIVNGDMENRYPLL